MAYQRGKTHNQQAPHRKASRSLLFSVAPTSGIPHKATQDKRLDV